MKDLLYDNLWINSCDITACQPEWSWDTGRYPSGDYDLWTVLRGRGILDAGGTPFPVSAGSCFLLRPRERYIGHQDLNDRLTVLHIHFDFLKAGHPIHFAPQEGPALQRQLLDFDFFRKILYKVLDASSAGESDTAVHWLQAALDELTLQDRQSLQPSLMRQQITALCAEIQESPHRDWRLTALADRFGYSPDYFGRLFTQMVGSPLSLYVIGVRMNQAKVLLRSSNDSIGEIALRLGYRDICFFSRQFRQFVGISPSAYRKSVYPERTLGK